MVAAVALTRCPRHDSTHFRIPMNQNEFIHAYSDDVIFLEKAKRVLEAEKPRKALASSEDKLRTASFCRMRIVIMVAIIEHLLVRFQNEGNRELLQTYFTRRKRVSNQQWVQALCDAFQQRLPIDPNIFWDYLSIKYLRNTIVTANGTNTSRLMSKNVGFPSTHSNSRRSIGDVSGKWS